MWNLGISFLGNCAFWRKSLQFRGEIYNLDGYVCLLLTQISENLSKKNHVFCKLFASTNLVYFRPDFLALCFEDRLCWLLLLTMRLVGGHADVFLS